MLCFRRNLAKVSAKEIQNMQDKQNIDNLPKYHVTYDFSNVTVTTIFLFYYVN